MNISDIKEEELVFTDKGTRVLFVEGDRFDKLLITKYAGKRWINSRETFEAVYEVLCDCGNVELRRHVYLANDNSVNGRCCFECARKNSASTLTAVRRGRPRKTFKVEEKKIVKNDFYYEQIIKGIFDLNIKETMSRYT